MPALRRVAIKPDSNLLQRVQVDRLCAFFGKQLSPKARLNAIVANRVPKWMVCRPFCNCEPRQKSSPSDGLKKMLRVRTRFEGNLRYFALAAVFLHLRQSSEMRL